MSDYAGMYNDWSPLLGEAITDDDASDEESDTPEETNHPCRTGKISRNHDGLCRRGHAGHRR